MLAKQRQQRQQQLAKGSLANHAIVRRVHFIYERALRKFRTDVSLWTAWLEWCRSSNSNRRLGRVMGRALQVHPTGACLCACVAWCGWLRRTQLLTRCMPLPDTHAPPPPPEPGLWVYAAAWELEHNSNPGAARALMQQGLRMCRHSEQMWIAYFDMVRVRAC
jgi:U3 small nucleolar RNA-associated protein 6